MNKPTALAPGIRPTDRVVLFDGVCRLCSFWARFLIRFDTSRKFKLATVQSLEGNAILKWYELPTDIFETLLLVEGANVYTKSAAVIRVLMRLPFPWPGLAIVWLIPVPVRDWIYDGIASNRYRIFGRYETCVVPEQDHDARFLIPSLEDPGE